MTIDEAIEVFQDDKSETILNLSELRSDELAKWLTELKAYRGYKDLYEQGRADAFSEVYDRLDAGVCEICDCNDMEHQCYKNCQEETRVLMKWLKENQS